jgi:hypothetical protein
VWKGFRSGRGSFAARLRPDYKLTSRGRGFGAETGAVVPVVVPADALPMADRSWFRGYLFV